MDGALVAPSDEATARRLLTAADRSGWHTSLVVRTSGVA